MTQKSLFTDISSPIINIIDESKLPDLKELQVGFGEKSLRVDRQGIWMGAKSFQEAFDTPTFAVTMQGLARIAGLDVSQLHIPNSVTTESFHVDSTGNTWWGCTVADFEDDPVNAVAYVLKNGAAKFSNVVITGLQSGSILDGTYIEDATISVGKLDFSVVDGDSIVATINASTEGIRIGADKIHIDGDVTFSSNWTDASNSNPLGWTDNTVANEANTRAFRNIMNFSITATVSSFPASVWDLERLSYFLSTDRYWIEYYEVPIFVINTSIDNKLYKYNWTTSGWDEVLETNIHGNRITTGTILASSIVAGTITGWTIKTSSDTTRVEIQGSNNRLVVYVAGSIRGWIGSTGYSTEGLMMRIDTAYTGSTQNAVWFRNVGAATVLAVTQTGTSAGTGIWISAQNIALEVSYGRIIFAENTTKLKIPVGSNLY